MVEDQGNMAKATNGLSEILRAKKKRKKPVVSFYSFLWSIPHSTQKLSRSSALAE